MFKIEQNDNGTFVASIIQNKHTVEQDDVGALYYVVVVIFLYGCSILMMIASYIRKNNVDRKLNRYLKDMANFRKREQQLQLFNATAKAAAHSRKSICLGTEQSQDAQKWHGASHWSRANEEILAEEARRKSYVRRASSVDSTEDELSRKPSEIGEENESQRTYRSHGRRQSGHSYGPTRHLRPSVRIICEQSDPESDNDAFLNDGQDDQYEYNTLNGVALFEPTEGETSPDDDNEPSQVVLLMEQSDDDREQGYDDAQVTEDSESDLFLGKPDQDSRKIQWLDFQVISSV